ARLSAVRANPLSPSGSFATRRAESAWHNDNMPYPEYLIAPMRQELTALGARECRTVADVDQTLKTPGVVMMIVNSVCGCAAGKARPGIAMALQHPNRPDTVAIDRPAERRQAAVHGRASRHRVAARAGHRGSADDGVRQVLRAGEGGGLDTPYVGGADFSLPLRQGGLKPAPPSFRNDVLSDQLLVSHD